MADWGQIGAVAVTACVTLAAVELRARREAKRDTDRWRAERRAAAEDRRAALLAESEVGRRASQRETLIAAQDAIGQIARGTGLLSIADKKHLRAGKSGFALMGAEDAETDRLAMLELTKMKSRIDDDQVRRAVDAFHDAAARAVEIPTSEAEINERDRRISAAYSEAIEATGGALRELDRADLE